MKFKRFIEIILRIFRIGTVCTVLLMLLGSAAVIVTFINQWQYSVFGYISYIVSAYALTSLIVSIPIMAAEFKTFQNENKLINRIKTFLYSNKYSRPIIMDVALRVRISLYISLAINLIYSGFMLFFAFYSSSFWFGTEAAFYIILSIVRFMLLKNIRKNKGNLKQELFVYRFCGYLLFFMNAALTGIVYQTIYSGNSNGTYVPQLNSNGTGVPLLKGYEYPGVLIYAAAIYAFFCLSVAIVQFIKYRKYKSPILSAVKAINLAKALVAMFSLQVAMFASFNEDGAVIERIMNSVTGGLLCCAIFAMAVIMVVQSHHKLKNIETLIKHSKKISL